MENNAKTNDWFASRLLNDDKDPAFLLTEGITPLNSKMETPEFYKNKTKVKERFTKDNGDFDEDTFNKFYTAISKEFEYLSAIDSENFVLDSYEKSSSNFTTNFGKVKDQHIIASITPNPLKQSRGLTVWNKWSDPTISNREAAQTNQYFDPETNTWSSKTLNELGAFGLLNEEGLVYATWDEDGEHIDPMTKQKVLHKAGEWKTDEFGNFYAEKAGNKENLNKQFVTWSEVLTDDNSAWNKIDIFDSDSLDSNIPRTILRAAVIGGSLLIPYVGPTIAYTSAAVNLTRVMPQILKTFTSFFSEDVQFDTLNRWDNNMRKFGRSTSDYAQDHFFSFENIMDLAVDSFMQLRQQRLIAEIPKRLGMLKKAEESAETATLTTLLSGDSERIAYLKSNPDVLHALVKASPIYRNAEKVINNATKVSTAISRAYLIATSTEDTYNLARSYGFDTQTSSMISLGTYIGIGALFQTDYFRGMLYNTPDYELKRDIKLLVDNYLRNNAKIMSKELVENATGEAKKNLFKKWGNSISTFLKNHVYDVKSGRFGIAAGALNEGLEEVAEEGAQDIAFQIGKGWNDLKSVFTGKEYDHDYTYLASDPLSRYGTAFFGGALGGAIFKLSDRFIFDKAAYKNWRQMLGNNSEISKELVTYVSQGKKDLILSEIDKLQKTPLISSNLSAFNDSVVAANSEESQNSVLFGSLKKAIIDLDSFLSNNNLKIDYEQFGNIELIRGLRAAWINSKGLQDSLFNDYINRTNEISQLYADLEGLRSQKVANMEDSSEADLDKQIGTLQEILNLKIDQVRNLVQGKDDSYIGRLMLETNKEILDSLTPTSKNAWAQNLYAKDYDDLPRTLQEKVNEIISNNDSSGKTELNYMSAWNVYKNIASNPSIQTKFQNLALEFQNYNAAILQSTVKNGKVWPKQLSSTDTITGEDVLLDMTKVASQLQGELVDLKLSLGQSINIAYRLLGLTSAMPDFWGDTAIPSLTFDSMSEELKSAIENQGEIITNNIFDHYVELFQSARDKAQGSSDFESIWRQLTDSERTIINRFSSIDAINKARQVVLSALANTENLGQELSIEALPTIDTNGVNNIVDGILESINPKQIKINDFINRETTRSKELGNQYTLDGELSSTIEDIKSALNILKSVSMGADVNYRTLLMGTPFGANNFLNKAFKEKGLNTEMLQLDPNIIGLINEKIARLNRTLDEFIELDKVNRGAVINQEKQLAIALSHAKLQSIQSMMNWENAPEFVKDTLFAGYSVTLSDISDLKGDDAFISVGVDYRNQLSDFERRFSGLYKSLDTESKLELINWIVDNLKTSGTELYTDTSIISTDNKIPFADQDFFIYLMNSSYGNTDLVNKAYKEYVKANDSKCPFDSQEEVITHVLKFFLRADKEDAKLWIDTVAKTWNSTPGTPKVIYNAIKSTCSGGTGKTSAIIPSIYSILKAVNPEKNCIFAANNAEQVKNLSEVLPENSEFTLISELLNDSSNVDTFRNKYENSIIIVDEATNISSADLISLDELCSKYNIDIAYFGDTKQHGSIDNIDYIYANATLQLAESKRASTDISRRNNLNFEKLFEANSYGSQELRTDNLSDFIYYESDTELEGIKFDEALLTQEYIEKFFASHNLDPKTRVLVLSDNVKELSKDNFSSKYPGITFASNVGEIQGSEWDYTISDYDLNIVDNSFQNGKENVQLTLETLSKLKDLYTIFTRHRHGIVSLKPIVLDNLKGRGEVWRASVEQHNDKSEFRPIVNGLTQEAIATFKDFKMKVLDGMEILDVAPYEAKDAPKVTIPTVKVAVNTSIAQATPGFIPSVEFTADYVKQLGIDFGEYYKVRNLLYQILTDHSNKGMYEKLLPEHLKSGEFRIKVQYNRTEDLYNLGNKFRDDKYLNGVHPWIVYSVNVEGTPVDITLGMFQNPETSTTGGLALSKAASVIGELAKSSVNGRIEPKYYSIDPSKITFSRAINPIAIQNRETNDPGYINIVYQGGKFNVSETSKTDAYNFASTTAAFYFAKGDESIVPVNQILEALSNLKNNYSSFESLAVQSGLYSSPEEFGPITELLSLDRSKLNTEDPKKQWKARSVPDLEGRFCSFVSLNIGDTSQNISADLKTKSTLYLNQILERNKQLESILVVLKDNSLNPENKKSKIAELLANKTQWTVSVLTYDNEVIESEKDFDYTLNGLQTNTILATSRNRGAYNLAIGHQLGLLLIRLSSIISDPKTKWGNNERYFNERDAENVRKHWSKYKEDLVNAYSVWTGAQQTEETLLEYLSRIALYGDKFKISNNYFITDDKNLLQSEAFMNYLRDIYVIDSMGIGWSKIIEKTNGIKYANKKFLEVFSGHVFPKLLKDNGLSIHAKGDSLSIQEAASFHINSKVIQPAQIYAHVVDTFTADDFKEISQTIETESSTVESPKIESPTIEASPAEEQRVITYKSLVALNKSNKEQNKTSEIKKPTLKPKVLENINLIIEILQENSPETGNMALTQLFEILNGERSKFEIPNLSNAEQQSLDQIEVILEDNDVIKIC